MKILWISHLLPFPPNRGVAIRSYNNLKEVSKYHDIYFITLYQSEHHPDEKAVNDARNNISKYCKKVIALPFESFNNRYSWYFLVLKSFFSLKSYKENWCSSNKMVKSIRRILNTYNFDLAHFDTISLLQYSKYLPLKIPIVINHHNIESHMMLRRFHSEKNILLKLFCMIEAFKLKNMEKKYCEKSLNLVVSKLDAKRLKKIVPSANIEIIPNGVDVEFFKRTDITLTDNSIIFVGGLHWYPNSDAMIYFCNEIWPLLIKKADNSTIFIIGRNPPDSLIELSKNDERIQLKGFVEDIRPLMSSATCYVCPMRTGGGTRLKILDALAMGVPLVATRMACEGIPVEHNETVLFSETPQEFVENIIKLFRDKDLRLKFRKNSIDLAHQEFDYKQIGIKLKKCYENETTRSRSFL